jgi:hypothetical protein
VSIAAKPPATAAALTAFFAVPLTFERVMELERFFVFVAFFRLVLPGFDVLARARFAALFEVRFDAFAISSFQCRRYGDLSPECCPCFGSLALPFTLA